MKKVLFALAIAGMFGFVACNNNNAPEATEEPIEAIENAEEAVENAVEEVIDSAAVAVEEVVAE